MATNLYALFGLTADAHPAVIKAAYRALAKQYHPDGAGSGNPEATAKFIELQNAYEILGDRDSRAEYDASFSQAPGEEIEVEQEASIDPDEIWKWEAQEHPEIDHIHAILFGFSPALGNRFRLAVINNECSNDPASFAADLERGYFEKYFGKNHDVQALARRFLSQGNRAAAKELNLALKAKNFNDRDSFKALLSEFEREYAEARDDVATDTGSALPEGIAGQDRERRRRPNSLLLYSFLIFLAAVGVSAYLYLTHLKAPPSLESSATSVEANTQVNKGSLTQSDDEPVTVSADTSEPGGSPNTTSVKKQTLRAPVHENFKLSSGNTVHSELTSRGVSVETASEIVGAINSIESVSSIKPGASISIILQGKIDFYGNLVIVPTELVVLLGAQRTLTVRADEDGKFTASLTGAKRVALVIGNANYRKLQWLSNPDEDAILVSKSLADLGFSVTRLTDANEEEMRAAMTEFSLSLNRSTEMALVFYSGHAIEIDSRNYLLPVDLSPSSSRSEIAASSLSLSELLQQMQARQVPTKVVIVDACRDNPFGQAGIDTKGLSAVVAPSDTFVAYSTAPGTLALDGEASEKNSPYSLALATALKNPASTIEDTFKAVRTEVMRLTEGQQVPWDGSSLVGRVSFASGAQPTLVRDFRGAVQGDAGPIEDAEGYVTKQQRKTIFDLFNPSEIEAPPLDAKPAQGPPEANGDSQSAAPASRKKQNYDRIVGEQQVTGEMQPTEEIPMAPEATTPADATSPADQVPRIEPAGTVDLIPVPDAPTQGATGLPEVEPPPPLPVPGSDEQGSASPVYVVQLASFRSDTDAKTEYSRLAKGYPSIMGPLKSQIRQTTVGGSTHYQLGLGPLLIRGVAARVCGDLITAGESDCVVRGPY